MKKVDLENITLQELACFVYETLKSHGIDAVLVGEACVSIYSENQYQSLDVDFGPLSPFRSVFLYLAKVILRLRMATGYPGNLD